MVLLFVGGNNGFYLALSMVAGPGASGRLKNLISPPWRPNLFRVQKNSPFRIIPEIDQNPLLQRFAETRYGNLALLALFSAVLISFNFNFGKPTHWFGIWEIVGIWIACLFPGPRYLRILAAISIAFSGRAGIDYGVMITVPSISGGGRELLSAVNERVGEHLLAYRAVVFAGASLLIAICLWITSKTRNRFPLFWPLFIWAALLALVMSLPRYPWVTPVSWGILSFFSFSFLALGYAALGPAPALSVRYFVFSIQNVWLPSNIPILRTPALLDDSFRPLSVCQLKGLKLLVWTRIIFLLRGGAGYFFSKYLGWPDYLQTGFAKYNAFHLPPMQIWASVLLFNSYYISLLCLSGIPIAIFRLSGIYLPRAVCRPYLAQNFNEYFRRVLYYYSEALIHLFFVPIYGALKPLRRWRDARIALSVFAAIFAGGIIYHTVVIWPEFVLDGSNSAVQNILSWLPYFAILGLCCCVFVFQIRILPAATPWPFRFAGLFTLHAIVMLFIQYGVQNSWADRIAFLRALFFLRP
ncbi:MAG: hypothetical protein ACXWSD_06015 [Bdellovibrionota bacterium]